MTEEGINDSNNTLKNKQMKKELITFLAITFAATYAIQILAYVFCGSITTSTSPWWTLAGSVSMFIPALVAILCLFYFKSETLTKPAKLVFALFVIDLIGYLITFLTGFTLIIQVVSALAMIIIIALNLKSKWRKELAPSKLSFGKNYKYYVIVPLIFTLIMIASFILNYELGFGNPSEEFNLSMFFSIFPLLIIAFFTNWGRFFGEEYGWRVYLQNRLFPLFGGYKGVIILGVIWGLWHAPIISMGYNYPGVNPIIGNAVFIFFTIVVGIIFSYAVLKTGSVWVAVILHLITDNISPWGTLYLSSSKDPILSFGMGIYGTALFGVLALVLLKSKVWKRNESIVKPQAATEQPSPI